MELSDASAKIRDYAIWSKQEDVTLVDSMISLLDSGHIINGTFKNGAFQMLEKYMKEGIPECNKKVNPHIKSRHKLFKKQYQAICEMRVDSCSGFRWDPERYCITVDDHVFNEWVKLHPSANGLKNRAFSHFDKLAIIFGKDRAIGANTETPLEAVDAMQKEQETEVDPFCCIEIEGDDGFEFTVQDSPNQYQMPYDKKRVTREPKKKQKKLGPEMMNVFSDTMVHLQDSLKEAGQQIAKLADAFKQKDEIAEKRIKLNDELKKVEELTNKERYNIGRKMVKDPNELDFFFSLDDEDRKNYVLDLAFESR